jgi:hypothetical protein
MRTGSVPDPDAPGFVLWPIAGGDGSDDAADPADDADDAADPATPAAGERTFSQGDVNRLIKRETAKAVAKALADAAAAKAADDAKAQGTWEELARDAETKLAAATDALKRERAEGAVLRAATKLRAECPDLIYRLLRDDLDFDADGQPTGVDALVEACKKEHPRLFAAATTSGGDGGKKGDVVSGSFNDILRGAIDAKRSR